MVFTVQLKENLPKKLQLVNSNHLLLTWNSSYNTKPALVGKRNAPLSIIIFPFER